MPILPSVPGVPALHTGRVAAVFEHAGVVRHPDEKADLRDNASGRDAQERAELPGKIDKERCIDP